MRFADGATAMAPDGRAWVADRVVIAVGGRAGRLPIPGAELGMTYEDIRGLTALPDRVCVIGAADTGCQITSILADFGCDVSLLEFASRILPRADHDVSAELERAFIDRGIAVTTATRATKIDQREEGLTVGYRQGDQQGTLDVAAVFFAVGWPANADRLDVEAAASQRPRLRRGRRAPGDQRPAHLRRG